MYRNKFLDISTFLKEDPRVDNVIGAFYDLNELDFILLVVLLKNGDMNSKNLTTITLERWPNNKINASLKKLFDIGLVDRVRVGNDGGTSTHYVYSSVAPSSIKSDILNTIENWLELLKVEFINFEKHLEILDIATLVSKNMRKEEIRQKWFD